MAEVFTPIQLVTFTNDTSAVNAVNQNFTAIATAFNDVLSRSGASPNQMGSSLDMSSNQILNLPPPSTQNSPARLIDVVTNPSLTIPATGTSGHVVPFLDGANTWSNTNTYSSAPTFSVAPTFSTALAVPNGVAGTATNNNATAGNVGEFISSTVGFGTPVSLTNGTGANITSIVLTAGDWDVWALPYIQQANTTNITSVSFSLSTTSATTNFTPGFWSQISYPTAGVVIGSSNSNSAAIPGARFSVASNTTIFLTALCTFTVSTVTAFGYLAARRVR